MSLYDIEKSLLSLGSEIAWIILASIGIFFVAVSLVLNYHWKKFALDPSAVAKASFVYFSVSAVLIAITVVSTAVYINSL